MGGTSNESVAHERNVLSLLQKFIDWTSEFEGVWWEMSLHERMSTYFTQFLEIGCADFFGEALSGPWDQWDQAISETRKRGKVDRQMERRHYRTVSYSAESA